MSKKLPEIEIKKSVEMYYACGKNFTKAAKILGITRQGLQDRIRDYERRNKVKLIEDETIIKPEALPESDLPIDKLIDDMCNRFSKRKGYDDAKKWRKFNVSGNKPIGICWFGDPHVDDNGCNWPLLKKHCDIVKNTDGMFGANIGDTHNNWVGRLMKEYANQDTSIETAYKLIDWFFNSSGIKWLIMLTGNHDTWNDDARLLKKMCQNICPMVDWRAQFKLIFSNGRECLIDAAHDFKGHSQWNSLHGQQKASTMGGIAHLYISGHRHNWALAQNECPETHRIYHLVRARGYKYIDDYAVTNGFGNQNHGAAIVTIIDPNADELNLVRCFVDVQEGADYLTYLRKK